MHNFDSRGPSKIFGDKTRFGSYRTSIVSRPAPVVRVQRSCAPAEGCNYIVYFNADPYIARRLAAGDFLPLSAVPFTTHLPMRLAISILPERPN